MGGSVKKSNSVSLAAYHAKENQFDSVSLFFSEIKLLSIFWIIAKIYLQPNIGYVSW